VENQDSLDAEGLALQADLRAALPPASFRAFNLHRGDFVPAKDLVAALQAHGLQIPPDLATVPDVTARLVRMAGKQIGTFVREAPTRASASSSSSSSSSSTASNTANTGGSLSGVDVDVDRSARLGIGRLLGEALDSLASDAEVAAAAATVAAAIAEKKRHAEAKRAAATGADAGRMPVATSTGSNVDGFQHPRGAMLRLISAHDTTLVPVLAALKVYDGVWPRYASYVSFELWDLGATYAATAAGAASEGGGEQTFAVRVIFNGTPLALPGIAPLVPVAPVSGAGAVGPLYAL